MARFMRSVAFVCAAVLVLAVAAALPLSFAGSARAAEWDTIALTQDDQPDFKPALDRGRVAWVGRRDGVFRLYTWDSLTGTTRLLAGDIDWLEGDLTVSGDLVIWQGGDGEQAAIYYWDGTTGATTAVPGPAGPAVFSDGRYVLWQAQTPATGSDSEVYLFDSSAGSTTQLSDNDDEDVALGVESGLVLVGRWTGGREEVVLYDPVTEADVIVTSAASDGRPPAMGGGWVAWLESADDPPSQLGDDLKVYAYEIVTGQTVEVTRRPDDRGLLHLGGGLVAWVEGSGSEVEVYVAAVPGGIPVQVSFDAFQSLFPQTDGRLVAWSNPEEALGRARVWTFGEDGSLALGDPDHPAGAPLVSGGRVVWGTGAVDIGIGPASRDIMTAVTPLFFDVPFGHHYFEPIQGMGERGLIAGYMRPDRWAGFRPANPVLRAQFAKMIDGALRIPVSEGMPYRFTDLGPDSLDDLYPHEYVAAVADAGITLGKTPTTFAPYEQITRAQVGSMVYRAAQSLAPGALEAPPVGYRGTFGNFSTDHAAAMRVLEYNGLLGGIEGFGVGWSPWAAATRAEVASILWELMKARAALVE